MTICCSLKNTDDVTIRTICIHALQNTGICYPLSNSSASYSKETQRITQIRIRKVFLYFLVIKGNPQTRASRRQQYTNFVNVAENGTHSSTPFMRLNICTLSFLISTATSKQIHVTIHFHGNTICTAKDSQTFRTTKKSEQLF